MNYCLTNFKAVNEEEVFEGLILLKNGRISQIIRDTAQGQFKPPAGYTVLDLKGDYLLPGVIDDQVHFREPGLSHKGEIYTESRAAVAGGVTSFMDMPNTVPNATTHELLEQKYSIASERSFANYSFYIGGTNDNLDELLKTDPSRVCGIKLFLGSSTGNMLVDHPETLEAIFSGAPVLVAAHCEDEATIRKNAEHYRQLYGEKVPVKAHAQIRSEEACFICSSRYVELAEKHGTRFHVIHISTARELQLFRNDIALEKKNITSEVCIHHLWFNDDDYRRKGSLIKWNPSIKTEADRKALFDALVDGRIDVIATDHAPHTLEEKSQPYFRAPSGAPMIQHSLPAMLEYVYRGEISIGKVVQKMCHDPARLFRIDKRGFIRKGYWADLVVVKAGEAWSVERDNLLYKCGWSPMEGEIFHHRVMMTFVNGDIVYDNGKINEEVRGMRLRFNS